MNILELVPETKWNSPIERVLLNRGFTSVDEINKFLRPAEDSILDPFLLDNMERGIDMLNSHLKEKTDNYIMVQVDSDCDGYTSAALLLNYIQEVEPEAFNKIYYVMHPEKEHGISVRDIREGTTLVIAPDSSSNEGHIHKALSEKGIDVLVIDHHEVDDYVDIACIINNHTCDYPNKGLSGAGVVYKFCQAYDSKYFPEKKASQSFVDVAALGIIGDMMDLKYTESQQIIAEGLASIKNPFFSELAEKNAYSIGPEITPISVAFFIVPFINAVIRMGSADEKKLLFSSMLNSVGYSLIDSTKRGEAGKGVQEQVVTQACRMATNVKSKQAKAIDVGMQIIDNIIQTKQLDSSNIIIIQLPLDVADRIPKSLTGLIANKLVPIYQKPVLILRERIVDGVKSWEGSGRGYDKSELKNLKSFLVETDMTKFAEGHANAFGVGVFDNDFNLFYNTCSDRLSDMDFTATYRVDYWFGQGNETYRMPYSQIFDVFQDLSRYKYLWGQGISEPLVAMSLTIKPHQVVLMKGTTIKVTLSEGDSRVAVIKFKANETEYNEFIKYPDGRDIKFVGRCSINEFNGTSTAQLVVTDYELGAEFFDF